MAGYTKNIAVIRGLKDGFSADGGPLTGLVKAENYGSNLKVEVTLINFAPLSEGKYVTGISDGNATQIFDGTSFEGASALDTGGGFAALICYVNGTVSPVASAVSGTFGGAAIGIKAEIEKSERVKSSQTDKIAVGKETVYEDEAIAEVNYYEFAETDESSGAVRKGKKEEKVGRGALQNEEAFSAFKKEQGGVKKGGLTRGNFYERMKGEIEGILSAYPAEDSLNGVVENSKWVKISYGNGKFYVFGVISEGDKPQYICYGVPTDKSEAPPESMRGLAGFIPASPEETTRGFWVMYQDASTGASLHIDIE